MPTAVPGAARDATQVVTPTPATGNRPADDGAKTPTNNSTTVTTADTFAVVGEANPFAATPSSQPEIAARWATDFAAGEAALPQLARRWTLTVGDLGRYLDAAEHLGKSIDVAATISQWLAGRERGALVIGWFDEQEMTQLRELATVWHVPIDEAQIARMRDRARWFSGTKAFTDGTYSTMPASALRKSYRPATATMILGRHPSPEELEVTLPGKTFGDQTFVLRCDPDTGRLSAQKEHHAHTYYWTRDSLEIRPHGGNLIITWQRSRINVWGDGRQVLDPQASYHVSCPR